jgi:hypothetical protein
MLAEVVGESRGLVEYGFVARVVVRVMLSICLLERRLLPLFLLTKDVDCLLKLY